MLSFLGFGRDAFDSRRKQQEVWKCIRRIVDQTAPNVLSPADNARGDSRSNRCLPMFMAPWEDGRIECDELIYAVTKDFSDEGVSLISRQEVTTSQVVCAFSIDEPTFFRGEVRRSVPYGGGFWLIGMRLCELLPRKQVESLLPLAQELDPRATV